MRDRSAPESCAFAKEQLWLGVTAPQRLFVAHSQHTARGALERAGLRLAVHCHGIRKINAEHDSAALRRHGQQQGKVARRNSRDGAAFSRGG